MTFWGNPFRHTAEYRAIALGSMTDLTAYYGPPIRKAGLFPFLELNYNYAMLFCMLALAFILISTKVLLSSHNPPLRDLAHDFIAQCMGQTRNREYTRPFAQILLITAFLMAYFLWVINCATLFSVLATGKFETFHDYSELNRSDREIYISQNTLDKYSHVPAILR